MTNFESKDDVENYIREVLQAEKMLPGIIDEYIDCILTYSDIDDYQGITEDTIRDDFKDWLAAE